MLNSHTYNLIIMWTNPCNQQARRNNYQHSWHPFASRPQQTLPYCAWVTRILTVHTAWVFCSCFVFELNTEPYAMCSFVSVWLRPLFLWNWSLAFRVFLASIFCVCVCVCAHMHVAHCLNVPQLFKQLVSVDISLFSWGLLWIMLLRTYFSVSDSAQVHVYFSWVSTLDWNCWVLQGAYVRFCRWCQISKVLVQGHFPASYFVELDKVLKLPAFFLLWFMYYEPSGWESCMLSPTLWLVYSVLSGVFGWNEFLILILWTVLAWEIFATQKARRHSMISSASWFWHWFGFWL